MPIKVGKEQKIFGENFLQFSTTLPESFPLYTRPRVDTSPKVSIVANLILFKYAAEEDSTSSRFVLCISIWICRHSKGTSEQLRSVLWQLKMSAVKRQAALERSCFGSWRVVTQILISPCPAVHRDAQRCLCLQKSWAVS